MLNLWEVSSRLLPTDKGLLTVFEFENISFMTTGKSLFEQFRLECGMDDDDVRAARWYKDGLIDFADWILQQKLQQTPCSTLRELLGQMLMEQQQKARHLQTTVNKLRIENNIDALQRVISLIDTRQPVA